MSITLDGTNGITTPDLTVDTDTLVVDEANNRVGIGTSSPAQKLDVQAADYVAVRALSTNNSIDTRLQSYSTGNYGYAGTISNHPFSFITNNTERARITSAGDLLVGTTSTTSRFVSYRGDAGYNGFFDSPSGAGSGVYAIGTNLSSTSNNSNCAHLRSITQGVNIWQLLGNGTSTFSSDERLKKNIETARSGYLDDVVSLRVVKYNWHTDDDSTAKELGLIAQEVEQIFPSLVVEDNTPLGDVQNPKAIKTSVLPYILLKAIQEQQAIIESLTARIEALEGAA